MSEQAEGNTNTAQDRSVWLETEIYHGLARHRCLSNALVFRVLDADLPQLEAYLAVIKSMDKMIEAQEQLARTTISQSIMVRINHELLGEIAPD